MPRLPRKEIRARQWRTQQARTERRYATTNARLVSEHYAEALRAGNLEEAQDLLANDVLAANRLWFVSRGFTPNQISKYFSQPVGFGNKGYQNMLRRIDRRLRQGKSHQQVIKDLLDATHKAQELRGVNQSNDLLYLVWEFYKRQRRLQKQRMAA